MYTKNQKYSQIHRTSNFLCLPIKENKSNKNIKIYYKHGYIKISIEAKSLKLIKTKRHIKAKRCTILKEMRFIKD